MTDFETSSGPIVPARFRLTKMAKSARPKGMTLRQINRWIKANYDTILAAAEANTMRLIGRKRL